MRKLFARRMLKAFAARYDYDVSYLEHMLSVSPQAFFGVARLTGLARHRQAAAKEAVYAAKLVGALAEDCGPCAQLAVDMAREAGVGDAEITAVLSRDLALMSEDAALGFRFAEALVRRGGEMETAREAVRARWGEAGVIDLTLAAQIGRVFPMVKAGLGFAESCRRVHLGGRPVDVGKYAA